MQPSCRKVIIIDMLLAMTDNNSCYSKKKDMKEACTVHIAEFLTNKGWLTLWLQNTGARQTDTACEHHKFHFSLSTHTAVNLHVTAVRPGRCHLQSSLHIFSSDVPISSVEDQWTNNYWFNLNKYELVICQKYWLLLSFNIKILETFLHDILEVKWVIMLVMPDGHCI